MDRKQMKTAIWPIFGAFEAFTVAIWCILRLHEKNTFLPEMDRGKSMKLCLDNRFPGSYTLIKCDPGQKTTIWSVFDAFKVAIWCILTLQNMTTFQQKKIEVNWSNYVVMTVCLTFTKQWWTENNNLTNLGFIQSNRRGLELSFLLSCFGGWRCCIF